MSGDLATPESHSRSRARADLARRTIRTMQSTSSHSFAFDAEIQAKHEAV